MTEPAKPLIDDNTRYQLMLGAKFYAKPELRFLSISALRSVGEVELEREKKDAQPN